MRCNWICAALLVISLGATVSAQSQQQFLLPGQSETRNAGVVQSLVNVINTPLGRRGGAGKSLGMYGFGSDIVYRSGYENLDPQTMAQWAYDLHQFILSSGGGWEKYQEYLRAAPQKSGLLAGSDIGGPDPVSASWAKSFVPYNKQRAFARMYWENNPAFKQSGAKDDWVRDSILDGNYVYCQYQQDAHIADATYKDSVMGALIQK